METCQRGVGDDLESSNATRSRSVDLFFTTRSIVSKSETKRKLETFDTSLGDRFEEMVQLQLVMEDGEAKNSSSATLIDESKSGAKSVCDDDMMTARSDEPAEAK